MNQTEADELAKLIREQAMDMRYGNRCWPQENCVSYDTLPENFFNQDGESQFQSAYYTRMSPVRTGLAHNKPHGTRCTKHPGEEHRSPKPKPYSNGKRQTKGQVYCRGCRREYYERLKGGDTDGNED